MVLPAETGGRMTKRKCPRCGKETLLISNVMGTTETIYWRCSHCCYNEQTGYDYQKKLSGQQEICL